MSGFLDTNMVVRYLIGDPPVLAVQAARIIDAVEDLQITDGVLAETAYVLQSFYRVPREEVVDDLVSLIQKGNVTPYALDKSLTIQGLLMCRPSGRVSFADALLWAAVRSSGSNVAYSQDRRFPADGIVVRQTP
jgi:predicted nucleic acid-binding protein